MEAGNAWGSLFALGTHVNLISDLFRTISFLLDGIIYSLIPAVFGIIYKLYDITSVLGKEGPANVIKTMSTTIYSFLAIFMFFKTAFSLLSMLVNPNLIEDKEKGAGKIVTSIIVTLGLIALMPTIFNYARMVQNKVIEEKLIETIITGEKYDEESSYSLGNELALSTWSVFLSPAFDSADFCPGCGVTLNAYNNVFNNPSNTTVWPLGPLGVYILSVTGVPLVSDIISRFPGINAAFGEGSHYQLSYVVILSTIVGGYLLWAIIKLCIDVAYRSIKFFALELLSPIAIVSNVDPNSAKKGLFSKWLKETVKTYLSLFIRLFVFALASLILRQFSLADFEGGFIVKIFYLLAIIAFIKIAPKFIDGLLGTELSKDGETKFASDLLKGGMGAATAGAIGGISGAIVAKRADASAIRGAWEGMKKNIPAGFNSGKKGGIEGMKGVIGAASSGAEASGKYFGVDYGATYRKKLNDRKSAEKISDEADAIKSGYGYKDNDSVSEQALSMQQAFTQKGRSLSAYHYGPGSVKLMDANAEDLKDGSLMKERGKVLDNALLYQQWADEGKITQGMADKMTRQAITKYNDLAASKHENRAQMNLSQARTRSTQLEISYDGKTNTELEAIVTGKQMTDYEAILGTSVSGISGIENMTADQIEAAAGITISNENKTKINSIQAEAVAVRSSHDKGQIASYVADVEKYNTEYVAANGQAGKAKALSAKASSAVEEELKMTSPSSGRIKDMQQGDKFRGR